MHDANPLILKLTQSGVLTEEDHEPLAKLTAASRFVEADTVLVEQGGRVSGTPLVMSGFAYRYKLLSDGQRQILGLLLPGDFCDIQGAILGRSDHFTATMTDGAIVWLSPETIDDLTLARSRIARAFWWATLVDECILRSWLTNMGQRPADRWLAHFLCEFLLRLQIVGCAGRDGCEMPFSQEKLGDILGITSVHVSRTFRELRERNLVILNGRRLTVPDVGRLRAFCDFDPGYMHLNGSDDASM